MFSLILYALLKENPLNSYGGNLFEVVNFFEYLFNIIRFMHYKYNDEVFSRADDTQVGKIGITNSISGYVDYTFSGKFAKHQ